MMPPLPRIIQGGMGVGVSHWQLARAVCRTGQLGVVSGTALDVLLARRLQDGDPGGHMRRGLEAFPESALAERIWDTYYVPGGKPAERPYRSVPMHAVPDPPDLQALCVVANFVEVFLARDGHDRPVGINYLEKIQIPHLPSLYGALLAGVDYVLMGAGIPLRIPGVLDRLADHQPVSYPLAVTGAPSGSSSTITFTPHDVVPSPGPIRRPRFLAIIASDALALTLHRRATGRVDGFVVEGPAAGGHNAPPRGPLRLDSTGQPVYGERDRVNLRKLRGLDRPFWLAGGYASPARLREALDQGAAGIQVGTAFALCAESGLRADYRAALLRMIRDGTARVFTDPAASPTGFPFKVAALEGSLSDRSAYLERTRVCDLGYLREAWQQPDGRVGFRCPAEPVSAYISKGGLPDETVDRKCICNALTANIGQGQVRGRNRVENGLVTTGDDLCGVARFIPDGAADFTAGDVVDRLLAPAAAPG